MDGPFSEQYGDIYFSAVNGLAEKRHVFLGGSNLPARWQGRDDFVVVEAGFGTGLSFLATCQMFLATTASPQRLHFISFEAHPMGHEQIRTALAPWQSDLGGLIDDLVTALPRRVPGMHRVVLKDRIVLTLVYGDINIEIPSLDLSVDAWFLDGFNPAKNPAMWSATVFQTLAERSAIGATAATYSAARVVKEGLSRVGFNVMKAKGFGYKSDMITARLQGVGRSPLQTRRGQKITILGGGLAGTAVAWALKQQGHVPVIVAPKGLADGASGNPRGLYNPRFTKEWSPVARFYAAAFTRFHGFLHGQDPARTGWKNNGALHLLQDQGHRDRLCAITTGWGWQDEDARIVPQEIASEIAGIPVVHAGLWLPQGGSVSPQKICQIYAEGIEIRPDIPLGESPIIYANGIGALDHPALKSLPLHTVRGQVSFMRANPTTQNIKTNLCFGGYLSAEENGAHVLGATFQRWLHESTLRDEDHTHVMDKAHTVMGPLFEKSDVMGGRVGFRVASRDHMPVVGKVKGENEMYVSLAHGSHGLLSTHLAAWQIAEMVGGIPSSIDPSVFRALDPERFSVSKIDEI